MLSVVLYGRNDNYGYNLAKRASLSLNSIAELLDGESDEIVFVDFNTPDTLPTFPETILDTLSPSCLERLRIIRVRPHHVAKFCAPGLATNEPLARNIGFRRTNPDNRWVLSTNTDMLFLVKHSSFSEFLSNLSPGQYGIPRYEIPASFWETFDRANPSEVSKQLSIVADRFGLRRAVTLAGAHRFDGPGDFQLLLREDLVTIEGADQNLSKGWHVDSNLAARIAHLRGDVRDLSNVVEGFHCDHTRIITPLHETSRRKINSLSDAVTRVESQYPSIRQPNWGLGDLELEEIKPLDYHSESMSALLAQSPLPEAKEPSWSRYGEHVPIESVGSIVFLLDSFWNMGKSAKVLWVTDSVAPKPVETVFSHLERDLVVISHDRQARQVKRVVSAIVSQVTGKRAAVVFDSPATSPSIIYRWLLVSQLRKALGRSQPKSLNSPLLIFPSLAGTAEELLVEKLVGFAKNPYSIGNRHGFLRNRVLRSSLAQRLRLIVRLLRRQL